MSAYPSDRSYSAQHIWAVRDSTGGEVTVGIDALALESIGELAYLSLPAKGTDLRRGEPMGSLEAAKMTQELLAPVSGRVLERNTVVLEDPTLVNEDPYQRGWLLRLEPVDWEAEVTQLIGGAELPAWFQAETERLADLEP